MKAAAIAGLLVVVLAVLAPQAAAQCSSSNFCTCIGDGNCRACVSGNAWTCQSTNASCTGNKYSGATAAAMCNTDFRACSSAVSSCDCIKKTHCGFCNGGVCEGGVDGVDLAGSCSTTFVTADNAQAQSQCKLAKAAIIGKVIAGVAVPIVIIIYIIVWWYVRGRWWWHSTTHERCCYAETAVCNGCCCFRPYPAQPPPHGKSKGPKSTATRVAPCWANNPCAACDNLDGWIDKKTGKPKGDTYRPLHGCGLGYACACAWMPGACCFMWPEGCRKNCCEDVQDGPIGKTPAAGEKKPDAAAAGAEPKKGKWSDKMKKKKGGDAPAANA